MTFSKFYNRKTKKSRGLRKEETALLELTDIIGKIKDPFNCTFPHSIYQEKRHYIPIEFFRPSLSPRVSKRRELFCGESIFKKFESSGTTYDQKAESFFSKNGLLLYKVSALKTFEFLLEMFFGKLKSNVEGFSLVPTIKEWPKSSLAQMIHWIQESQALSSMTFVSPKECSAIFSRRMQKLGDKPCFLFATAAHFLSLIKTKSSFVLPKNVILIETGGFKNVKEDLDRADYYQSLSDFFQISESKIVSEYGMAELSCQAYDWQDKETKRRNGFRFPSWVDVRVIDGLGMQKKNGIGALTVYDPLRIDYRWPIRTQDIAQLKGNKFSLLGRVPGAVLKGCSLGVKEVIQIESSKFKVQYKKRKKKVVKKHRISHAVIEKRMKIFVPRFIKFLNSSSALNSVSAELNSASAAKAALSDLIKSLPGQSDYKKEWLSFTKRNFNLREEKRQLVGDSPRNWLFIPPSNHSFASLCPLISAYLVGINVFIRLPKFRLKRPSFLEEVICFLQKFSDAHIKVLPNSFRIGKDNIPKSIESILCYGETSTINEIKKMTSIPVKGFGTYLTLNIVHLDSLERESMLMIKDAFSLGQRGCMSSRMGIVVCNQKKDFEKLFSRKIEQKLKKGFYRFWNSELTYQEQLSLNHEEIFLESRRVIYFRRETKRDPLFPIYFVHSEKQISRRFFESALSSRPYVFPLFIVNKKMLPALLKLIDAFSDIRRIAVCKRLQSCVQDNHTIKGKNLKICSLGSANIEKWVDQDSWILSNLL